MNQQNHTQGSSPAAPEEVDFIGRESDSPSPFLYFIRSVLQLCEIAHCHMSTTLVQLIDDIMLIGLGDQEELGILDTSLTHTHTHTNTHTRKRERERKVHVTVVEQISFSGKTHFCTSAFFAHWRRPIYIMEGNIP